MDSLLQKANIDEPELRSFIIRLSASELGKLSEPCHYPTMKGYFHQLLSLTGLTISDIKEFFSGFYKEYAWSNIHKDPHTNLLILIMYYFLKKRDIQTYLSTMLWHVLKQYSHLMHIRIPYCNSQVFMYTLEHLSKTHLFVREKGISGAMYHITQRMQYIYTDAILSKDAKEIAAFITASRTRVQQSIASFQNAYYKHHKEGSKYRTPYTGEEGQEYETLEKRTQVVDTIKKSITVYKEIDEKAILEAKTLTKVRESLARLIVGELSNITYQEEIRMILDLFIRDIKSTSVLCGEKFFTYVKSLMAIKRTTKPVYFKQQINELLIKLLKATNTFSNYNDLTSQSQSLINSFLALYITMFARNKLC